MVVFRKEKKSTRVDNNKSPTRLEDDVEGKYVWRGEDPVPMTRREGETDIVRLQDEHGWHLMGIDRERHQDDYGTPNAPGMALLRKERDPRESR
mmetsp:Transcript_9878/g.29346  ORF Transcript_9878/g.29346 Transcript_9878/m.29346 type:complete len:94 (+) Transcript_9878:679-960(+)